MYNFAHSEKSVQMNMHLMKVQKYTSSPLLCEPRIYEWRVCKFFIYFFAEKYKKKQWSRMTHIDAEPESFICRKSKSVLPIKKDAETLYSFFWMKCFRRSHWWFILTIRIKLVTGSYSRARARACVSVVKYRYLNGESGYSYRSECCCSRVSIVSIAWPWRSCRYPVESILNFRLFVETPINKPRVFISNYRFHFGDTLRYSFTSLAVLPNSVTRVIGILFYSWCT